MREPSERESARKARVSLSLWQVSGLVLGVVVTGAAAIYAVLIGNTNGRVWLGIASFCQTVIPVLVTILVVPNVNRESLRDTAVMGVDELQRLHISQLNLHGIIQEIVEAKSLPRVKLAAVRAQSVLENQSEHVESNLALWCQVHPEAVNEVYSRRKGAREILEKFESDRKERLDGTAKGPHSSNS